MAKGLILINTGDGKGKTTAGFGMILRTIGHQKQCHVIQFIKQRASGEIEALRSLASDFVTIEQYGLGFTWESDDLNKDKAMAQEGWNRAKAIIAQNKCKTLLLDEITYPVNYEMIDKAEVINTLKNKPADMNIIITGRDISPEIAEIADCVSEIVARKHHYNNGIPMQKTVEF